MTLKYNFQRPETDFVLIENAITEEVARELAEMTLERGKDPVRGFKRPKLKPNRPGLDLNYPVKKYMCYSLYWDPSAYVYNGNIPGTTTPPFPIPELLEKLSYDAVQTFFPHHLPQFKLESCYVNFYTKDEMGIDSTIPLHKDKEEIDLKFPVIGLSLGSTARFMYQGLKGTIQEITIPDRSLYLFGDSMRLMRHGVKEVLPDLPANYEGLLAPRDRLNFNLRKVY